MKKIAIICLVLGVSTAAFGLYYWSLPFEIRHYTLEDLAGSTCAELGEKHEEVIFAYHDASIAGYNKTGAFDSDLGLPQEADLPFVILMKKVIKDNNLSGFDLSKPFFQSASVPTPRLHADFFAEATSVCATNPTQDAREAMLQAARNLGLTR